MSISPQFKNLIIRTITGIVFVSLIVLSFFIPRIFFQILFVSAALIGTYEYLRMVSRIDLKPQLFFSLLISFVMVVSLQIMNYSPELSFILFFLIMLLILGVFIYELFRKTNAPIVNISVTLLPAVWIALPFGLLGTWAFFLSPRQPQVVLLLFIILWASDTFAYCGGSLFGKHKLFERISPKKTWEGTLISLLLTCTSVIGLSHIPYFKIEAFTATWHWIGFTLIIIVFGTFGDLVESMLKRNCEVKDSGKILPGHGGILDRFDSMLLAAPAAFLFWLMISFFG